MKAIIIKNKKFGSLNGEIIRNSEILTKVNQHIKSGTARILIDTEDTLMYELNEKINYEQTSK